MPDARELRFVLILEDYDAGIRLFRDAFGLEVAESFDQQVGRGVLLRVPAASLELLDREHGDWVDEIEVGRTLGGSVRIAVRVDDLTAAGEAAAAAGARPVADPVGTPWGDRNRRFESSGLQLTLFQTA